MEIRAFISGLAGLEPSAEEKAFFKAQQPWGFIFFARNVETPDQVRRLSQSLREAVDRSDAPILIDQEGGRVQRLRPPHWGKYPSGAVLGGLYERDARAGLRAAWLMSRLHAFDLLPLGINVDCLPVLDVPAAGSHDVVGDRAYGRSPDAVAALGRAAAEGLKAGGVMPVMKHMPGHGRARVDSHKEVPVVEASREELEETDFAPFAALNGLPMAMTAHVIYSALDRERPATASPTIIRDIIREKLGFDGLLMSDDVSMQALSGDIAARSQALFQAGCDMALHCNGDMSEMKEVASAAPVLAGKALERARSALTGAGKCDDAEEMACREEFAHLMADIPMV